MSDVYMLQGDSTAQALRRLRAKDENKELQSLLLKNPYLLPSEQIDPENPPQWLLVKREMPVVDPATGSARWSIDFLYVDHMGIPTLVECKRCDDTRTRREVIAQMLEYAANGHHYWSASELLGYAQTSVGGEAQLLEWIGRVQRIAESAEDFFAAVERNLRESRIRLVFFLEESPNELRSLVNFLNNQLKSTDVLLVEARMYESTAGRVIVPWLYGYTEEARVAKKESRAEVARAAKELGEDAFRVAVEDPDLPNDVRMAIQQMLDAWPTAEGEAAGWLYRVNAIFMVPSVLKTRGLFHVARNGDIQLYLGYWATSYADVGQDQLQLRDRLAEGVRQLFGINLSEKQMASFPAIKATQWVPKVSQLIALLKGLAG